MKAKRVVRPAGGGGASRDSTEYFFSLKKKGRTGSKQIVFFSNQKLAKIYYHSLFIIMALQTMQEGRTDLGEEDVCI